METWKTALQRGLIGGAAASLCSTVALAALGQRQTGSAYAPTNAVSHIVWGDRAFAQDAPSLRYTLPGYALHHGSAVFWSVLFERACAGLLDRRDPISTLGAGLAASGVACLVDYQFTPDRFKPGYEERLSKPALALVYGVFGAGLALGALLARRSD